MREVIAIHAATTPAEIESARTLLREYANYLNDSVGEEHICLDSYEKELASLPGVYAPPRGILLLALVDGEPAGCVGLKPLKADRAPIEEKGEQSEAACEMKRLWVRPQFRGHALGLRLAQALLDRGRSMGYTAMYLDTMPATMQAANRMYHRLGFESVSRYADNPVLAKRSGCEDNTSPEVRFFRRPLV